MMVSDVIIVNCFNSNCNGHFHLQLLLWTFRSGKAGKGLFAFSKHFLTALSNADNQSWQQISELLILPSRLTRKINLHDTLLSTAFWNAGITLLPLHVLAVNWEKICLSCCGKAENSLTGDRTDSQQTHLVRQFVSFQTAFQNFAVGFSAGADVGSKHFWGIRFRLSTYRNVARYLTAFVMFRFAARVFLRFRFCWVFLNLHWRIVCVPWTLVISGFFLLC